MERNPRYSFRSVVSSRFLRTLAFAASLAFIGSPAAAERSGIVKAIATDAVTSVLPADRSIRQSIMLAGKRLGYRTTVGSLTLRDDHGIATGHLVFVAYTVPTAANVRRPVTFSFNGGPGAAQLQLDLGGIGPKYVDTAASRDGRLRLPSARDNPATWLGFTDLVFIDPIGTGYSRSLLNEEVTRKAFLTADSDVDYLSEAIYEWLRANGRMRDAKYLVGESYGGYRVARIARHLQTDLSIGVSGVVMVSPALIDVLRLRGTVVSPIREMIYLPSEAATNIEAHGGVPSESLMAPIEDYARTQYLPALLAGTGDQVAKRRLTAKVAELTGLPTADVDRADGRVSEVFLRDFRRGDRLVSSAYDGSLTAPDPFPEAAQADYDDPALAGDHRLEAAMVDLIDRQVGWHVARRYIANNYDLNATFDRGPMTDLAVADLRKALANDRGLTAMIANGWTDFGCPYFASRLVADQLPASLKDQLVLHVYAGGHAFYLRPKTAAAFQADVKALFAKRR